MSIQPPHNNRRFTIGADKMSMEARRYDRVMRDLLFVLHKLNVLRGVQYIDIDFRTSIKSWDDWLEKQKDDK